MKINWHPNPLYSTIEIDDRDRRMMLLYVQNEEYTEILFDLQDDLEQVPLNPEVMTKRVAKWEKISNMDITTNMVSQWETFLTDSHCGDCTCVPAGCTKCYAEGMLDVSTIEGLGKHQARKIMGAFGMNNERTIDEALEIMAIKPDYIKTEVWRQFTQEYYDSQVPRWESERLSAIKWLTEYKQKHNF